MLEPKIELVMSEFGTARANAGGAMLSSFDRLNPTLDGFLSIFPGAKVTLYTDMQLGAPTGVRTVLVDPPFLRQHERYGWRAHDYYQVYGLLNSSAQIAIAMDSDMKIVSPDFRVIELLARKFGLALPMNPRLLARVDGLVGADSTYRSTVDETLGSTFAYNLTPIAFSTEHAKARTLLERYLALLTENPGRGAVHLSKAVYELGNHPCLLPAAWCVCSPRDYESPHVWRNAIALHVGHADVEPRWQIESAKMSIRSWHNRLRHFFK